MRVVRFQNVFVAHSSETCFENELCFFQEEFITNNTALSCWISELA